MKENFYIYYVDGGSYTWTTKISRFVLRILLNKDRPKIVKTII